MKLKEIHRTSTFAWSPSPSLPLLATGTVAGALDESFSNNGQLEIWDPDWLDRNQFDLGGEGQAGPKASVTTTSRFNRLAWGYVNGDRPRGVIVAGMENGELDIWDPAKIVANADPAESLILRNKTHTGPVRGLDFNPIQTNLFSSGAVNGEIYVWDLKDPSKPYSPGTRSTKLDEITALAWNHHVQYALAASSSTGYTVVWDLRGKREVAALAYGGGAGTLAGGMPGYGGPGFAMGGRRGMSDVAWHPDNATRLVTSSEDDASPVIMVWDLRNARAPEKILTGHEKGVLSLSWCKQDSDLLLSCGKDNRALCWNPQTSEIIGELPSADNWAFQVQWCPRNPDLFAAAFFDGTIGIHSIQSTNEAAEVPPTPQADAADIFGTPGFSRANQATLSLKHPPKWLRRPTSNSFGYGGNLVTVSNLPSAQGKNQSSVVHIRKVVTEIEIVDRAKKLQTAIEADNLKDLAQQKTGGDGSTLETSEAWQSLLSMFQAETAQDGSEKTTGASATWKALLSLFKANSRDELITLLGFSKDEVAARVAEAVANLKKAAKANAPIEQDVTDSDFKAHEPVVSFAEPEREATPEEKGEEEGDEALDSAALAAEATPSEVSASGASDTTSTTRQADGESTTTAPSLFGDDNLIGTPQGDAAADFFGSIGTARTAEDDSIQVPHHNYPLDSSVAATIGSRPSSVASEVLKDNTFRIYPADESETDRLVTKALVLGDFESAVSLCLSTERYADAILLAVKGGPELLARTQKAYFERRTTQLPYLRLFQSIVTNDLDDIVQNADLQEWQEIFVVLCTFASQEEFSGLAEQLGQRLEFQSNIAKSSGAPDAETKAAELRRHATLTYLAAGRLERLVNIWIEELAEDEKRLIADQSHLDGSLYTAHAYALQTFIEKVTIFRKAINYVDEDLNIKAEVNDSSVRTYKLSALYDRYFEYADLLATQGLVKEAVTFLKLVPSEYHGSSGSPFDFAVGRDRLLKAANETPARSASLPSSVPAVPSKAAPIASTSNAYAYGSYVPPVQQPISQSTTASTVYEPYAPPVQHVTSQSSNPYAPPVPAMPAAQPYQQPPAAAPSAYNPYSRSPAQPQGTVPLPPPPRAANATPSAPPLGAPPQGTIKRDNGGWNDAPAISQRRTPANANPAKPAVITSPFPNAPSPTSTLPYGQQPPTTLPPPPRPGSVQQRPPPPPQAQRGPPPPGAAGPGPYPPHARPPSGPPGPPPQQHIAPPPQRGPPGPPHQGPAGGLARPPPGPGPYGPPQGGPVPGQTPPPPAHGHAPYPPPPGPGGPSGPYARATPPPQFARAMSPPGAQAPNPYAPPPQAQPQFAPPHPGPAMAGPPMGGPPPGAAPPPAGPPRGATPAGSAAAPQAKAGPPQPKYPPGDRSHIPDELRPVFQIISGQLEHLKQVTPPQQKRLVDDLERRINPLFDALNCETLSKPVCEQLLMLARAMEAHDRETAMAIHMDLLTRGSLTDDIGLWMSGIKQLIIRL